MRIVSLGICMVAKTGDFRYEHNFLTLEQFVMDVKDRIILMFFGKSVIDAIAASVIID